MPIWANPSHPRPTHHISLTDGQKTVGLIAVGQNLAPDALSISRSPVDRNPLKTTSGANTYSDFNYPYSVIAQDNWSGGRGNDQFEKDQSRFFDSYRINTERSGAAFLGGLETYATQSIVGVEQQVFGQYLPGDVEMKVISGFAIAVQFVAGASITGPEVSFFLRHSQSGEVTFEIREDSAGVPGTVLTSKTETITTDETGWVTMVMPDNLVAGTYWACFNPTDALKIGVGTAAGRIISPASATTYAPYFRVTSVNTRSDIRVFEYKSQLYATKGTLVYINGDRGAADSNAGNLNKLIDATKTWATNEWAGCIVKVIGGLGKSETTPWRTIVSNDATSLTVSPDWEITHDTTTSYVILGSNHWKLQVNMGVEITSACVSEDGVCYFARGDGQNIYRMREYNNSGTWTLESTADGTNKAQFLQMVFDATNGWELWRGQNNDASGEVSVSKASTPAWGTNLSFGTVVKVGLQNGERINGIEAYVDANQAPTLWIFTDGAPWYIQSGKAVRVPLREFEAVRSEYNGRASTTQGVNLFFSLGTGLQRYYDGSLDDIGPNLGEGLPENRRGYITSLVAYPGRLFAAIDAADQTNGYSSVLAYNGGGWHEVYRTPKGCGISSIWFQSIPGTSLNRLWIAQNSDLLFIPFPSDTFDPRQDDNYTYFPEGSLTLSWMNAGLADAYKYFRAVKLFLEEAGENQTVTAEYRLDQETTWTPLSYEFDTVPVDETTIGDGVNGRRIQLKLRFQTEEASATPILKAGILESVVVTPTKHAYSLSVYLKDNTPNLLGEPGAHADSVIATLDEWSGTAKPLKMRCIHPLYDDVDVFLMPSGLRPVSRTSDNGELGYFLNIVLQEA